MIFGFRGAESSISGKAREPRFDDNTRTSDLAAHDFRIASIYSVRLVLSHHTSRVFFGGENMSL
jgi:hypothetical protein